MANDLKDRTVRFAIDTLRYCPTLPAKPEFRVMANQLMRAGTSIVANHRAACRSKSKEDFINKFSILQEEADESEYWLELLESLNVPNHSELFRLKSETQQLVVIMVQSKKTARTLDQPEKLERPRFVIFHS